LRWKAGLIHFCVLPELCCEQGGHFLISLTFLRISVLEVLFQSEQIVNFASGSGERVKFSHRWMRIDTDKKRGSEPQKSGFCELKETARRPTGTPARRHAQPSLSGLQSGRRRTNGLDITNARGHRP